MNHLRKISEKYSRIWWISIIAYLIPVGIFMLGLMLQRDFLISLALVIFFLNVIGSLISSTVQIKIKRWYYIFPQLIVTVVLIVYVGIIFMFSPPDFYGAHKQIPENIDISEPLESIPKLTDFQTTDLIISGELGYYNYYTNIKPIESGTFYLKAFEVTSNDPLSEERLKDKSKIKYDFSKTEILSNDFTIYEGSWGDKYGVRLELWFTPNSDKADYKLIEKNFIIEGWMR